MFQQDHLNEYTTIAYHMSWPGVDPYHNFNVTEANTRRVHYQVVWVPWFVSNGNNSMNTETSSTQDWKNHLLSQATTSAPIELSIAGSFNSETLVATAMITVLPEAGTNGDYTLHFVLVEDDLYHPGSTTSDDLHQAVMRDMIPNASGTSIALESGVETVKQFKIGINPAFAPENCRLVAFVQGSDGSILNAATEDLTALPTPPLPLLSVRDTQVSVTDDDGDMKLNRGETAQYLVTLSNECNWESASNVQGILTSNDPHVIVLDSVGTFGDLTACEAQTNLQSAFRIKVADDTPAITELDLSLRVTTWDGGTVSYIPYEQELPLKVKLDRFKLNFPVKNSEPLTTGNAVADLDGDGIMEIIICGLDSALHVFQSDGSEFSGFPFRAGHTILGSPAVADIDNNGDLEIVFASQDKKVYVLHHDGTGGPVAETSSLIMGTPAIADLDKDGDMEIVIGNFASELSVLHHDGTAYAGFPLILTAEIISKGAAIADLNNDGNKDIVFGTWKGLLHAVDLTGAELTGFPVDVSNGLPGSLVNSPPVITDIDGDGSMDILVGQDKGLFLAVANTGDTLWTHQLSSARIRTSAAVADFDENGTMETVFNTLDGMITVVDHLGNDLSGWPQTVGEGFYSSPVIADLTGDRVPEIIVGTNSGELFAFHIDGSVVADFPVPLSSQAQGTPTVADIDGDRWLDIVIGTDEDITIVNSKIRSSVGYKWSTARGDLQRTGFYNPLLVSNDSEVEVPSTLIMAQNFPNPFNANTTIEFGIPEDKPVTLRIFDALGHEVSQLVNTTLSEGSYSVVWNGMDKQG
ncbi:MAG: FG-GAP-like repeat-containing protein, partial [Candidatus Marinimicrobia bacterium]|nr:FG-GAP-like repeat-containing protein [Candidatus Neomarinimicrobiota bacterium]